MPEMLFFKSIKDSQGPWGTSARIKTHPYVPLFTWLEADFLQFPTFDDVDTR